MLPRALVTALAGLAPLAAACSSSSSSLPPPTNVVGSAGGLSIANASARGSRIVDANANVGVWIEIASVDLPKTTCDLAHGATYLTFSAHDQNGSAGPGTYRIEDGAAQASLFAVDNACMKQASAGNATKGQIVLSAVTDAETTGTFDLTFPDGHEVHGAFDAPTCTSSSSNRLALPGCD